MNFKKVSRIIGMAFIVAGIIIGFSNLPISAFPGAIFCGFGTILLIIVNASDTSPKKVKKSYVILTEDNVWVSTLVDTTYDELIQDIEDVKSMLKADLGYIPELVVFEIKYPSVMLGQL